MLGITALQSTSASGVNITSAQTVGTYANGAGDRLLRPRLVLSSLNGAAATITVRIRNTTDGADVWGTSVTKGATTDTVFEPDLPSFYAVASKSYALVITSTNSSDTSTAWAISWFDAQQADITAYGGTGGTFTSGIPSVALTSAERTTLAAAIEAALVNDGDATALLDAIANKIGSESTDMAILAAYIRDQILNRVLAGNHDTAGTPGKLLQDAATASALATAQTSITNIANGSTVIRANDASGNAIPTAAQNADATKTATVPLFRLALRKDAAVVTDNAADLALINADGGSGAGAYSPLTDSPEAIRDRGDAAWVTGTPSGDGDVLVNHDYGGTDALQILDDDSDPIDGAVIRAITQADYDAGNRDNIVGQTTTTADGRWAAPLMLDPDDYYLIISKTQAIETKLVELTVT